MHFMISGTLKSTLIYICKQPQGSVNKRLFNKFSILVSDSDLLQIFILISILCFETVRLSLTWLIKIRGLSSEIPGLEDLLDLSLFFTLPYSLFEIEVIISQKLPNYECSLIILLNFLLYF